ncbi:hypothetical protein [Paraburkholderia sp. BL6669N2]|uniref:hypothetical protein n=1 Tax=Paraburkholderia sp. BL6669N2 TaxID=1938807 RepID=UPI0011C066F0|nr:hypothetical protein [Paraburkholderia sp. BL6669N2]
MHDAFPVLAMFGRFCHALTVASLVSFVGYWHSTSSWTWSAILNEAALAAIIVLTFTEGMDSMKRRMTMGFGVVALILTIAICAYGKHMSDLGRKADRERRHPRVPR